MANYGRKKFNWAALIAGILAVLLVVGAVFGVGYHLGWFTAEEEPDDTEQTEEVFSASNVLLADGENNGIQLLSKALYDNGSDMTTKDNSATYDVEATITPANTTNQSVTMSVAWADSTSTWATGKTVTDYVTITQDSTGSLTGTLACKKEFGEQVILTVALDSDSSVYATATVDYVARVIEYESSTLGSFGNILDVCYHFGNYLLCDCSVTYGTGTIYGEFTEATVYFDLVNDTDIDYSVYSFLNTYVKPYADTNNLDIADFSAIEIGSLSDGGINSSGTLTYGSVDKVIVANSFMDFIAVMIPDATQTQLDEFEDTYLNDIISTFLDDYDNGIYYMAFVTVEYTYSYDNVVYNSGSIIACGIELGNYFLTVNGTGVSVNNSSFMF